MSVYQQGGALVLMPHEFDYAIATANLARPGLVVAEDSSDAGQVVIAIGWTVANIGDGTGADSKKRGIASTSTLDRDGNAQTGKTVTIIPLESGAKCYVALYQSNTTITVGDALGVSATDAGTVDKITGWDSDTAANYYLNLINMFNLVGFACEAKDENQGTTAWILTRLARGLG